MQNKIKSLLPSLKEKKRYISIRIETLNEQRIFSHRPLNEMVSAIKSVLGVFDSAQAGIIPVSYNTENKTALLKVSNKSLSKVKASLLFINEIGTQNIILRSVKVSGMLNKAKSS